MPSATGKNQIVSAKSETKTKKWKGGQAKMVGIADYSGSIDDLMRKIEIHLATEGPKTWVEIRTALQVGAFLSEEATDFLSAMVRLKVEERIGVDDSGETILYYVKT